IQIIGGRLSDPKGPAPLIAGFKASALASNAIDFGEVKVGDTAYIPAFLSLGGRVGDWWQVDLIQIAGENADEFAIVDDGCTGRRMFVRPDGVDICSYNVAFTPKSVGPKSININVFGPDVRGIYESHTFFWIGTGFKDQSDYKLSITIESGNANETDGLTT